MKRRALVDRALRRPQPDRVGRRYRDCRREHRLDPRDQAVDGLAEHRDAVTDIVQTLKHRVALVVVRELGDSGAYALERPRQALAAIADDPLLVARELGRRLFRHDQGDLARRDHALERLDQRRIPMILHDLQSEIVIDQQAQH